jgi:hypothetical protein
LNDRSNDILVLTKRIEELGEAINGLAVKVDALSQLRQQLAGHLQSGLPAHAFHAAIH